MSVTGRLLVEQIITGDGHSGGCSPYSVTEFCATSRPSRPPVVFSFQTGVLFSIRNSISWPLWANLDYFIAKLCTFWRTFYRLKRCGVVSKLTNIGYGTGDGFLLCTKNDLRMVISTKQCQCEENNV